MEKQVTLILGGAGGIGRATARELLRQGANVALGDVSADAGEDVVRQLRREFGAARVLFLRADVCSDADLEAAFVGAKEHFQRLDIVVNAAGILDDRKWKDTVDINAKGVVRATLLAWKHMGKHEGGKGGVVVNIASIAGLTPYNFSPVYVASKYAVVGFSTSIGKPSNVDCTGVRVFTICSGKTDTQPKNHRFETLLDVMDSQPKAVIDMLPMQQPEDVAKAILHVIQQGDSGSVWVCENAEPAYEVAFPPYQKLRVTKSPPPALPVKMALEGQVALVLGGGSGMGRATARELLRQGANVALGDVSADAGEDAARQLRREFGAARVLFLRTDVCSDADMEAAFVSAKEHFQRLDIVVNAAGIMNERDWSLTLDINMKGLIRSSLLAWKHMGKHKGGSGGVVVNISSILGLIPVEYIPIYVASKFGVVGLGSSLAMQTNVDHFGVRVFTICPGKTNTRFLEHPYKTLLEDYSKSLEELGNMLPMQEPEHVAREILRLIQHGGSGGVWVCENSKPAYEVAFPSYTDCRVTK